jgi:hypothetical protein
MGKGNDAARYIWSAPTRIPALIPRNKPRNVFPSPRIRRPSLKFLQKSTGTPPPHSAATGFGIYAGSMIQRADNNDIMKNSILII